MTEKMISIYNLAEKYGVNDIEEICLVVNMTRNKLTHILATEGDANGQRRTPEYWITLLKENFHNYNISKKTFERQIEKRKVS
jgi:hypothetical protein